MSHEKMYLIVHENYEINKYDLKMATTSLDMSKHMVRSIVKDEAIDAAGVAYEIEIGTPIDDGGCYCGLNVVAEYNTERKLQLDRQAGYNIINHVYDQPLIIEPDDDPIYLVIHHHAKMSTIVMAETSLVRAKAYAHTMFETLTKLEGNQVVVYSIPLNTSISNDGSHHNLNVVYTV